MALTEEQKKKLRKASELNRAAMDAEKEAAANQPQEEEGFWSSVGRGAKNFAADFANSATLGMGDGLLSSIGLEPTAGNRAANQGLQENLLFGVPAYYVRNTQAAGDYLSDKVSGNGGSYQESLADVDAKRKAVADEHPYQQAAGAMLGAAIPLPGDKTGPLRTLADSAVKRYAGSAALGGGQAALSDTFSGKVSDVGDLLRAAGAGAVGGALGQGIMDLGKGAIRVGAEQFTKSGAKSQAKRLVGESLDGGPLGNTSLAHLIGEGTPVSPKITDDMLAGMGEGGDRMFAESRPETRGLLADLMQSPDAVGMMQKPAEIAASRVRNAPREIRSIVEEGLSPTSRPAMPNLLDMNIADRKQASEGFKQIFDSAAGSTETVLTKHSLLSGIVSDTMNDTPEIRRTYDAVKSLIKGTGDTEGLTMKGLQNIKVGIDNMIKGNFSGLSSAEKMSQSALLDMKNMVKQTMEDFGGKEFKEASAIYGTTLKQDEAIEFGANAIKASNSRMSVTDLSRFMDGLSDSEKIGVQEGTLGWLLGQADDNPNFFRKLADENPDKLMRMSAIFGGSTKETPEQIAEKLRPVLEALGDYKLMTKGRQRAGRHAVEQAGEQTAGFVDWIRGLFIAGKVAGGDAGHGSTLTQTTRLLGRRNPEINRTIMDLLQETDPVAAAGKLSAIREAAKKPKATDDASRIGGAFLNTILNAFE